jgi:anti-sigma B factor antagonist
MSRDPFTCCWAAGERQRALGTEMGKSAHPAGSHPGAEPRERWRRASTGARRARPTTVAYRAAPLATSQVRPVPTDGELSLSSERGGHKATVTVTGELDLATAPALADELRGLLDDGMCRLTVDLSEMTFIDSTGLATLVGALRTAREGGGDIVLHAPRECVRKVLEISGADRLFVLT